MGASPLYSYNHNRSSTSIQFLHYWRRVEFSRSRTIFLCKVTCGVLLQGCPQYRGHININKLWGQIFFFQFGSTNSNFLKILLSESQKLGGAPAPLAPPVTWLLVQGVSTYRGQAPFTAIITTKVPQVYNFKMGLGVWVVFYSYISTLRSGFKTQTFGTSLKFSKNRSLPPGL